MAVELELWLDESGDFDRDDQNRKLNPSIVGGVLVKKGDITEEMARGIIGKDYVHFNEELGDAHIELLQQIKRANGEFVIFENKERVQIIDSDTTYLNVLAEGIVRLLSHLAAIHRDFKLHIIIATRLNTETRRGIIDVREYEHRLRERIIVGIAKNILTRQSKWEYDISFADARYDVRIMLADGVCNAYLTRTAKLKFTDEQRKQIKQFYSEQYIYSFYEHSRKMNMEQLLADRNISEVVFECYLESNADIREQYLSLALDILADLDEYWQTYHLRTISTKIDMFIRLDRNYEYIKPVLIALQNDFLPKLAARNIDIPFFALDVILYLYSLYTHEGSTEALEQDRLFMKKLKDVHDIMLKFDYYNMYKLRQAINQKNLFDINGSIENGTQAIQVLEEMVALLDMIDDGKIATEGNGVMEDRFEALGKAYGTRGQGYAMLIHQDKANLERAINDFDEALTHFELKRDQERQHLYKIQAYAEAEMIDDAIQSLYDALFIKRGDEPFYDICSSLQKQRITPHIYKYHAYFKILATAVNINDIELADKMYDAFIKSGLQIEQLQ